MTVVRQRIELLNSWWSSCSAPSRDVGRITHCPRHRASPRLFAERKAFTPSCDELHRSMPAVHGVAREAGGSLVSSCSWGIEMPGQLFVVWRSCVRRVRKAPARDADMASNLCASAHWRGFSERGPVWNVTGDWTDPAGGRPTRDENVQPLVRTTFAIPPRFHGKGASRTQEDSVHHVTPFHPVAGVEFPALNLFPGYSPTVRH